MAGPPLSSREAGIPSVHRHKPSASRPFLVPDHDLSDFVDHLVGDRTRILRADRSDFEFFPRTADREKVVATVDHLPLLG